MKIKMEYKTEKAKEYLKKYSFEQTNLRLKKEFGSGMGFQTLTNLRKELKDEKETSEESVGLTPEIKSNIRKLIDLFEKASELDSFNDICNDDIYDTITQLEEVIA